MQAYLVVDINNASYADFLQQLIEILQFEQKYTENNICYICNTLKYALIENRAEWQESNKEYIKRLQNAISRKMRDATKERAKEYKERSIDVPMEYTTLTYILDDGESTQLERRVKWLKSLIKYHKSRGTSKTFHETRNWLKT